MGPARLRLGEARPEYYSRVFGELKPGEFLEWYNIDFEVLSACFQHALSIGLEASTCELHQTSADPGRGLWHLSNTSTAGTAELRPGHRGLRRLQGGRVTRALASTSPEPPRVKDKKLAGKGPGSRLLFRVADVKRREARVIRQKASYERREAAIPRWLL